MSKGKVLADVDVAALGDRLRLRLPAGRCEAVAAHLLKYRIAEQVELERRPDLAAAELRGRSAAGLLVALGLEPPIERGGHVEADLGGVRVRLRSLPRAREPRYEIAAPRADLATALAALRGAGRALGLVEPSAAEVEAARIEDGELRWGVDYDDANFPQETGESAAISTTKGCYLGQEVIARLHFRGEVQRKAFGLEFEAGAAVAAGEELLFDGRAAARVTSVTESALVARPIGLALVHRRAAGHDVRLQRAGGGEARVVALPFVLPID